MDRKTFLKRSGVLTAMLLWRRALISGRGNTLQSKLVEVRTPLADEDIFAFIQRETGHFNLTLYRQIIGASNPFKEGDQTIGVAAVDDRSRFNARALLANTTIESLEEHSLFTDDVRDLIYETTDNQKFKLIRSWTMGELKSFLLKSSEGQIKEVMPGFSSDIIAFVVKLMTNDELVIVGQKVFNPLPGSKIGSKGYLSARVQPNSPTDNIDDIIWQVFSAWSYGVGDLVLGTNPVSSEVESVARIEAALFDVITTFGLQNVLPNCVLSHIDVQAEVERIHPGTTGIWFQSLAGTVEANQTFDVTIEKMFEHARQRNGQYGLYAETGQGADFTNGHGEGFDMVVHESRKYGFLRALKIEMANGREPEDVPWVHLNDVAGFIGPEVFRTKEQLVRTCLEDTVMGKLHGLPIGLDICSTLHMDVDLDDLDWCIDQVMPANPAYLMALPTKNDPMLSYLTTAFNNHVRIREQFGYRVNDEMWSFFKNLGVIGHDGQPTEHYGDPIWVYYKFRKAKNDDRSFDLIAQEGRQILTDVQNRGVPIAEGYGQKFSDLNEELDQEVRKLYEDAKVSLWTTMTPDFTKGLNNKISIRTQSVDRQDYVYHPETGEQLNPVSRMKMGQVRSGYIDSSTNVQILISDGLNARAIMDEGHLEPYLNKLIQLLEDQHFSIARKHILITNGRVRAGYECGKILFGQSQLKSKVAGIIHIIGERPGSGHHNFSAYLTAATSEIWSDSEKVDHDISKVVSGISDTALSPNLAARMTVDIFSGMCEKYS